MQPLRVGIVGCGLVTQVLHLPSLAYLTEQFRVTALCDVSDTVLQTVGETWQVMKRYHSYQDLVAQDDVDAVLVANPDGYHADVALAAIASGKHVLIEKPMCMTLGEADAISAAQREAGVTVQVGQMRRYAPAFVEAVRLLPELGDIHLARVHALIGGNALFIDPMTRVVQGGDVPAELVAEGKRRYDERVFEAIGEASPELRLVYMLLLGLSSHDLSTMRELLGVPKRVLYATHRQRGLYYSAAFDYGDYVCHFETGIDDIPRFDSHVEVFGKQRVMRVQYNTPFVRNLPIRLHITEANGRGGVVERADLPAWGDAFVEEWRAFYTNITEQRTPKTSPEDFRKDLELFRDIIVAMR